MGLITLLTDFGHRDSYVGVMKGVMATISPQSQVVDLTHGIQPQAILAARFNLLTSYEYFPAGTVHLVVVDPGVGTRRTAVAAAVNSPAGVQTIVAPDNGMLTGFSVMAAVALTNSRYWRTLQPSCTFHGRDIFAPVAAHLANGVSMAELGMSLSTDSLVKLDIDDASLLREDSTDVPQISRPISSQLTTDQGYRGTIQYCDHFGNLVTNILGRQLVHHRWQVWLGECSISCYATYGDAEPGTVLALIGSHGYVEIAVNGGSAADELKLQVGDSVMLIYVPHGLDKGEL
ncbi:MAG: SAM-dependent chlorinase/fluorinase [Cyanobacteria bacterium P01_H01_bin.105]